MNKGLKVIKVKYLLKITLCGGDTIWNPMNLNKEKRMNLRYYLLGYHLIVVVFKNLKYYLILVNCQRVLILKLIDK